MKLASLKEGGRDGTLIVANRDMSRAVKAPDIATTLQAALENWAETEPALIEVFNRLQAGNVEGAFDFDPKQVAAPLPRSYHWADGSAYVTHVELVRKARGAVLPDSFYTDPLMYMGASDVFLGPCDDVPLESEDWGIDFESEVAIFTDDVPAGITPEQAKSHIKLITIINDVSLRNLIPAGTGQAVRILPVQTPYLVCARSRYAGRTGRCLGWRQDPPTPAFHHERYKTGVAKCRRR